MIKTKACMGLVLGNILRLLKYCDVSFDNNYILSWNFLLSKCRISIFIVFIVFTCITVEPVYKY